MKRRVIGVFIALVMALAGTALVASFVKSAEARALAGEELVDVLVVTDDVAAGMSVEEVLTRVRVEQVPAKVRAADALESLDLVNGLVTEISLKPGEQITASRFVAPDLLTRTRVAVPSGKVEVTVSLAPERAVGGALLPGDMVTVFASFDPFDISAPPSLEDPNVPETVVIDGMRLAGDGKTSNTTRLMLNAILVTIAEVEELVPELEETGESSSARIRTPAPTGNLLITLALDPDDAERVVFTAEHGRVWLGGQNTEIDLSGTRIQHRGVINEPAQGEG